MKIRTTIPDRCNEKAFWLAPNGYRTCSNHVTDGMEIYEGPDRLGRCDYALDGLEAKRYCKPNT